MCSCFSIHFRTTTNILFNDDDNSTESVEFVPISGGDDVDFVQPTKRRRTSSNGEQMKIFETFTKTIQENHVKKLEMFQQVMKPQSEMELFFASLCKTCEKFNPIEKAKLKMELSRIVSQMELEHLQNSIEMNANVLYDTYSSESIPLGDNIEYGIECGIDQ